MLVLNTAGGVVLVAAAFVAITIAGKLAEGDRSIVRQTFPYWFGACLIALDVAVRIVQWRRIVARDRQPTLLTRQGASAPPRDLRTELREALFSGEAGGQYLFFLPAWIAGIAVVAATLIWRARGNP
jgi:hypothetical protein